MKMHWLKHCSYGDISVVCIEYCLCAQTVVRQFLTKQLPYLASPLLGDPNGRHKDKQTKCHLAHTAGGQLWGLL